MYTEHQLTKPQIQLFKESLELFKAFQAQIDFAEKSQVFSQNAMQQIKTRNDKVSTHITKALTDIMNHNGDGELTISPKVASSLHNTRIELLHLSEFVSEYFSESIVKNIRTSFEKFSKAYEPILAKENHYFDENYKGYNEISKREKLKTTWSMYHIPAEKMDKEFINEEVAEIEYDGGWGKKQTFKINQDNKPKNWVEFWKIADKLIIQSGDTHHIFIEQARYDPKSKKIKISTGS